MVDQLELTKELLVLLIGIGTVLLRLILVKINKVLSETSNNGGASMKDHLIRIEESLMDVKSFIRIFKDIIEVPTFKLNETGELVWANEGTLILLACDLPDIQQNLWKNLILEENKKFSMDLLDKCIEEEKKFEAILKIKSFDSTIYKVKCIAYPSVGLKHKFTGFIGSFTNIQKIEDEAPEKNTTNESF